MEWENKKWGYEDKRYPMCPYCYKAVYIPDLEEYSHDEEHDDIECDNCGKLFTLCIISGPVHYSRKQISELPTCPGCGGKAEFQTAYIDGDGASNNNIISCCNCPLMARVGRSYKKMIIAWIGNRVAEYNINDYKQYWEVKDE